MPGGNYFTTTAGWPSPRIFGQDYSNPTASLTMFAFVELVKGCVYNESGWGDLPGTQGPLNAALAEQDRTRAADRWAQIQRDQIENGGLLVWGWLDWLDAVAKSVHGLSAGTAGPLNNYRVLDAWLAKT